MGRKTKQPEPQQQALRNFYTIDDVRENMAPIANPNFALTQMKIPFHCLAIGRTGTGKTNAIMNMIELFSRGDGTFSHIYIFHKINEPLYDLLQDKLGEQITFIKKMSDLPEPKDLDLHGGMPLMIFDDVVTEKNQKKIEDYYIYGRKLNKVGCCCVYISQKYFSIPKIIRGQSRYIFLLKIRGDMDLKNILRDVDVGLDIEDFKSIYEDATKNDLDFLKIDTQYPNINMALSRNFRDFYQLE